MPHPRFSFSRSRIRIRGASRRFEGSRMHARNAGGGAAGRRRMDEGMPINGDSDWQRSSGVATPLQSAGTPIRFATYLGSIARRRLRRLLFHKLLPSSRGRTNDSHGAANGRLRCSAGRNRQPHDARERGLVTPAAYDFPRWLTGYDPASAHNDCR